MCGSSPLARGTRAVLVAESFPSRLIPARAGNTGRAAEVVTLIPAHPRSRGEHPKSSAPASCCAGSSPLARGTQARQSEGLAAGRLIPARAGNTPFSGIKCESTTAHPRSRGEHSRSSFSGSASLGSSPLARGTLRIRPLRHLLFRLIPARAGNTLPSCLHARRCPAHPRSRGEHMGFLLSLGLGCGSSPLARGTRVSIRHSSPNARLIPARAGNT